VQGEWVMEVRGLDYPQKKEVCRGEAIQSYSAVEFFLQAVHRTEPAFQPSPEDLATVSKITQLLEGMPLGLELAATWVNMLSCQEIADELSKGLDILETSWADISERQRNIRAVFDHSWHLMSNREQVLLSRLTVFHGSFSRQAAEQVAGAGLRELSGLIDKSLVRRAADGRFDLHDLLRQYSAEKLEQFPADSRETRRRHCVYYGTRLVQWNTQLGSVHQGQALREMESELGNLQAAWEWAIACGQAEYVEQAVDAIYMFYLRRARFTEGRDSCQNAFETLQSVKSLADELQHVRLSSRLLTWQAVMNINLERFEDARQLLVKSAHILDAPGRDQQLIQEQIFMLVIRALLASLSSDIPAMLSDYERVYRLSGEAGEKSPRALVYIWRFLMGGSVSKELYSQMQKRLVDVQQAGDPFELGCHLFVLGIAQLYHAYCLEKAEPLLRESIQNFGLVEDPSTQVMIFKTLGYLLSVQGKFEENMTLKQRELEVVQDIGDRRMIGITLAEIGESYCHLGDYSRAEDHIRAALALVQDYSMYEFALRHRYLGDVLLGYGKYKEAREAYQFSFQYFESQNEKGWMLTALTGLSRAELALGDRASAWVHAKQALQLYSEMQLFTFFAYLCVAEVALLFADRGEVCLALELYGLVLRQGYLAQSRWFADLFERFIDKAASNLSLEEQTAAKKRGQAFDFAESIGGLLNSMGKSDSEGT
jgi:tetratricopeptide (TPR) repeat protein